MTRAQRGYSKTKSRTLGVAAATAFCAALSLNPLGAQSTQGSGTPQAQTAAGGEVRVLEVRNDAKYGQVHMLRGAGGNITAVMSGDGIVLVDAGSADMSEKVLAALRALTGKQVWTIINTSADPDHTGGNEKIAQAGNPITRGGGVLNNDGGAQIFAQENVLSRMSGVEVNASVRAWPTDVYIGDRAFNLPSFFYGDAIQLKHFPRAHTNGDSMVWFRHADVISTGDLFRTDIYPVIDLARGGNVQGVLDGLNWVLETAITHIRAEGGTLIIPGHGRLCDSADVAYYRDMVTIVRDRVRALINKGMTLEQVKASRITADYDRRYGSTTGTSSTDMFVEAVYKSLITPPKASARL